MFLKHCIILLTLIPSAISNESSERKLMSVVIDTISLSSQVSEARIIPILQVKKLKMREVE